MSSIHLGLAGIIPGRYSLAFGPQGWTYRIRERGLHADMVTRAGVLKAAGWVGDCVPIGESPKSEIVATYAVSSDPSSPGSDESIVWEMDCQFESVPAIESETYLAWRNAAFPTDGAQAFVDSRMKTAYGDLEASEFSGWISEQQAWYKTIQAGRPIKEVRPVLTKLSTFPSGATSVADWTDILKVWTTAQITSAESSIPSNFGTIPSLYWYKTPGRVSVADDGRVTRSTHWIAGNYLSHEYTFKT
jgi:hypothetical protein